MNVFSPASSIGHICVHGFYAFECKIFLCDNLCILIWILWIWKLMWVIVGIYWSLKLYCTLLLLKLFFSCLLKDFSIMKELCCFVSSELFPYRRMAFMCVCWILDIHYMLPDGTRQSYHVMTFDLSMLASEIFGNCCQY